MRKLRVLCASILLLLGLAACASGGATSEPTSVVPQTSNAPGGVVNPASPGPSDEGGGTGYVGPSAAPAVAPAITTDPNYPAPSVAP